MAWARLDDAMLDNEKVVAVGAAGFALHVAGILYCARNLTDGFIPTGKVPTLLDCSSFRVGPARLLDALVTANLWHPDEERKGYMVHDYLVYNPSREQALTKRGAARERQAKSRRSSREVTSPSRRDERCDAHDVTSEFVADSRPPVPLPQETLTTSVASVSHARARDVAPPSGQSPMPLRCPPDLIVTPAMLEALRGVDCEDPPADAKLYVHVSVEGGRRDVDWTEAGAPFAGYLLRHGQMGCAGRRRGAAKPVAVSRANDDWTGRGREDVAS